MEGSFGGLIGSQKKHRPRLVSDFSGTNACGGRESVIRRGLRALCLLSLGVAVACSAAAQSTDSAPLLTLDSAIQISLAKNRDLRVVSLSVDKSKWQVTYAKTQRLPSFSTYLLASGSVTESFFKFKKGSLGTFQGQPLPSQDASIPLSSGGMTGYALASVSQPLTQLYKINLSIREQELAVNLNSEQVRAKRQSVVANVKQAYYAVLQTESALEANQAAIKQYEETSRVTWQYLAKEAVLKSDSLEVDAKLAQVKYQTLQLENNLKAQKEQLNDLLGRDIETDYRTQQVPSESIEEMDLIAAQQLALAWRPEIRQAEINVKKAKYDRKLSRAQYIPDINASIHYFSPLNTEILPTNVVSAGLEMNWEPFEWGRRRDDTKQKDIAIEQSGYQLAQARSQVLLDVNNCFRRLAQSRQFLVVTQAAKEAAYEKLRETSQKYGKEAVLLKDVLQQQAAAANADHDYEEALLSFWTARANFERALGQD